MLTSLREFTGGVWARSYYWAFALVLDPFDIYNRFKPDGWARYDVSLEAFSFVLFALILWTAFLTYHDLRKRTENFNREADMPLHRALRWIARDSIWAEKYSGPDDLWISEVEAEFWSKWQLGRFEMMGVDRTGNGGVSYIPPIMKGSARFDCHKLVSPEAPTHIWSEEVRGKDGIPRCFYNVYLDEREVKRVWPPRSLWARLRKVSPIDRIGGYGPIFALQDAWYSGGRMLPETPLEWMLSARDDPSETS